MLDVEVDGDSFGSHIDDLAGAVATGGGESHVVLGERQVHDGIVVNLAVEADFRLARCLGHGGVQETNASLFVTNRGDG